MLLVKYFFYQKFLENYCFLNNINRANVRQDRCSQTMVRGPLVARFLWKNWIFMSFLSYFFFYQPGPTRNFRNICVNQ